MRGIKRSYCTCGPADPVRDALNEVLPNSRSKQGGPRFFGHGPHEERLRRRVTIWSRAGDVRPGLRVAPGPAWGERAGERKIAQVIGALTQTPFVWCRTSPAPEPASPDPAPQKSPRRRRRAEGRPSAKGWWSCSARHGYTGLRPPRVRSGTVPADGLIWLRRSGRGPSDDYFAAYDFFGCYPPVFPNRERARVRVLGSRTMVPGSVDVQGAGWATSPRGPTETLRNDEITVHPPILGHVELVPDRRRGGSPALRGFASGSDRPALTRRGP